MNKERVKLKRSEKKNTSITMRGVGIDMEEVSRFREYDLVNHPMFYQKIFTDKEIAYCMLKHDPYPSFAARFAAKEAIIKAVGKSIFDVRRIEILNEPTGRPVVMIHSNPEYKIEVSLSHTKDRAAAIALWLH